VFYRDEDLPPDSHQVHLRGLRGVRWPQYCVKCGAPTSLRMLVKKVFRRRASGSESVQDKRWEWHKSAWHYVVRRFRIPYCRDCIARQETLRDHVSPAHILRLLVLTPYIIPFSFALFFAFRLYDPLVVRTAGTAGHNAAIGIFALLIFTILVTPFFSWRSARFHLIPRTTEITRACQPSDRLGWYDTGFHRIYAFESVSYASSFAEANRDRVWNEHDQRSMQRRKAISTTVILVGVAAAFVWLYVLKEK